MFLSNNIVKRKKIFVSILTLLFLQIYSCTASASIQNKIVNGFRRFAGTYKEPEEYTELLMFTTDEGVSGYADKMEQLVSQLEDHLKVKVQRLNIWKSTLYFKLFEKFDGGYCNGLPLLVNRSTGAKICGSSTKRNLLNWATGNGQTQFMGDYFAMPDDATEGDEGDATF